MNGLYKGMYDALDILMDRIYNMRDDISGIKNTILRKKDIPEDKKDDIVTCLVDAMDYLIGAYHSSNDALNVIEEFINL